MGDAVSRFLGDGCEADRETWKWIEDAGFASVKIEHVRVPLDVASPHIFGTAIA